MGLTLSTALRFLPEQCIAFVGAGGKTTAIFHLARELPTPVIVTTTTHLGVWQISLADKHIVANSIDELVDARYKGVTLITGTIGKDDRTKGIDLDLLFWLRAETKRRQIPLLIEADGARQNSLKAPMDYEPSIPDFANSVVVVAGMSALGKPLSEDTVYRPEIFSKLSGLQLKQIITPNAIIQLLCHPLGGQKNIPAAARRTALLNQCDTPELQSTAHGMIPLLLSYFDSVIISSMKQRSIFAAHERVAGIILAAGGSKRYGQSKQLLDWRGQSFVHAVAKTALEAGLSPVVVITGANAEKVEAAVNDLPVTIKRNDDWQTGQSSSIRAGIKAITEERRKQADAAVFLLADQPQITGSVIRALIEAHAVELQPIIAPLVLLEQRGNPVLFDRVTFPDLMELQGDVGGRSIFSRYHLEFMPWHDDRLLLDVDKPEDYQRLIEDDTL
jgi:molybdenum cofactor cytidylyltransferase